MELRHLRYFLAVSAARSFMRAAVRLHVTQPTLSHQIKQLEAIIGIMLFERNTKEIELTAAGRLFRPYCERILKEIESSKLAISELEGLMRGTLRMVIYAAFFPMIYSVWTGVRAVNPLWLRAATVMGADEAILFRKVIWPGSLPYVINGLRLSFGRAWIGVIGGELLASPQLGLGEIIFNAKEFLVAGVMLSTLVGIGAIGVLFERFVFQAIESVTVRRWGMDSGSSA